MSSQRRLKELDYIHVPSLGVSTDGLQITGRDDVLTWLYLTSVWFLVGFIYLLPFVLVNNNMKNLVFF